MSWSYIYLNIYKKHHFNRLPVKIFYNVHQVSAINDTNKSSFGCLTTQFLVYLFILQRLVTASGNV